MKKSDLDREIAKAKSLPCWKSPSCIEPLDGGITNTNLLLTDEGKKFVVRLGDDIPEHGVMRFNELTISRAANKAGISPEVIYAEPGVMVLEYVDASPLTEVDFQDSAVLLEITDLLRRVHTEMTQHLHGPVITFWVFQILRNYIATLTELKSKYVPQLRDLMEDAGRLEKLVGPIQLVLGHNDLLPGNILRDKGKFWLIDWEYGGFNSPLFDLGGLASNNNLQPEAEYEMLKKYFEQEPDNVLLQKYGAMKCASLLRETMWSMVSEMTSKLDFDYAEYTRENLARYRKSMDQINL